MKKEESPHLDNDQLVRAVVDETDLSAPLRDHLAQCPECLSARQRLEQDLAGLGRMADRMAPSPSRKVSLTTVPASGRRARTWRFALGPALSTVLAILVAGWFFLFRTTPQDRLTALTVEMWEDYEFLSEIETLAENPLPRSLRLIADESNSIFDEEFIDFLVPDIDPQDIPNNQAKKGSWLC